MRVDANGEKVYVSYNNGMCAARFCRVSAEFYTKDLRTEFIKNCSFEDFQVEVKKRYGAEVVEEDRPLWSKPNKVESDVGEEQKIHN